MNILSKNPLAILAVFILIVSIPITVYLVQKQQIFKGRAEEAPLNFTLNPNHPRLWVDAQEVEQIKNKIQTQTWARNNFAGYQRAADCLVGRVTANCGNWKPQVVIPDESTLSSHNYLCPRIAGNAAGIPLDYGRYDPARGHYCTANGTYYPGNTPAFLNFTQPAGARQITLQDIWAYYKHEQNIYALLYLGLTYQLSTQPDSVKILYAQKAREILLAYAQKYPTWTLHDSLGCWLGDSPGCPRGVSVTGGKMYDYSLGEANWIAMGAAAGYDLVYDSGVFTATESAQIENNLFRKMVEAIRRNTAMSGNNWQSWHNSAIGLVGFLLGDQALINEAINGTTRNNTAIWGFKRQICELADSDGFWNEGTGYSHYVMYAYILLAESARHAGTDLYGLDTRDVSCVKSTPRTFKKMFEVTQNLIFPNGRLPALEDVGGLQIAPNPDYYDLAYSRFDCDPVTHVCNQNSIYPWLVNKLNPQRPYLFSFLYGQPILPTPTQPALNSNVLKEVGYGVLRAGTGDDASYTLLDFGPFGGHGHYDKLNVVFYQNRNLSMADLGSLPYGSPLYGGWVKQTLAHNTFVVDGRSQAQVSGQLIPINGQDFRDDLNFKIIRAEVDNAYPNTSAKRILALNQDYLIDSLEVSSTNNQSHTYDLPFHGNVLANLNNNMALETNLGLTASTTGYRSNGYQYLTATQSATLTASPTPFWAKWSETTQSQPQAQEQVQSQTGTLPEILEVGGEPMDFGSSTKEDLVPALTATLSNFRVQVTGLSPALGDKVFSTVGPFPPIGRTQPFLIWRKTGTNAKFISVIESYTEGQRKISNISLNGDIVTITFVDGRRDTFNLTTLTGTITTPTPTPRPTATPTPTPQPTATPTPIRLVGDIDQDGDVDIFDYNILVSHFGPRMPPGGSPADLDHDGDVDIFDYNLLVSNFGRRL